MEIDIKKTALVLIDLQRGIVSGDVGPNTSETVVGNAAKIADAMRRVYAPVVLVRVTFAADGGDRLSQRVDQPAATQLAPGWDEIVPVIGPRDGDIMVVKHQWGAFHDTGLDLQLRRRGIDTIILAGISTSIGVESTARAAYEHFYSIVLVEDAMADRVPEAHENSVQRIFPRLGRVRRTSDVLTLIGQHSASL
ncbi:MAG TPA: hydrolase [Capsulimonadaceae bacterium]